VTEFMNELAALYSITSSIRPSPPPHQRPPPCPALTAPSALADAVHVNHPLTLFAATLSSDR
jgi:hypothetical protein